MKFFTKNSSLKCKTWIKCTTSVDTSFFIHFQSEKINFVRPFENKFFIHQCIQRYVFPC
ncbi:406R [Invertebrate iridescent virus Kaz2018]|uniref:406R n=1 Tax=Invertebrate iridescent virus 6 TaxID=176652 RepID=Q91FB9_IIV6|nr:406R [Invertebrate iridescent virus 6]AAK82266.1 406R [Invertebrate iridescent virus 6]QMS79426.1 hypothetical protein IIV6-T1_399 [Invertebrate iridescent virus 6]QNH08816.1 406R [Invertebrate iridescent virus Kaz2018]